jgi:SAM-dependent methyltransferase
MVTAQEFDAWYADLDRSQVHGQVVQEILGLPPEVDSTSLLPWSGVTEIVADLGLAPGRLFADLACGRGGYGLAMARMSGARVVGVDFAPTAVAIAQRSTERFGLADDRAEFRVGDMVGTGLDTASVDALICVDAIQFAEAKAALAEFRRILVPGGRLALTCWESRDPDDDQVPERLRAVNLSRDLTSAGFDEVEVREKLDWKRLEHTLWTRALELDAEGDPAVQAFRDEATRVLGWFDAVRRVYGTATAPRD